MKAKKRMALLLAVVMILGLAACGSKKPAENPNATRIFTDSTGREVEVPAKIDKVALSGQAGGRFQRMEQGCAGISGRKIL